MNPSQKSLFLPLFHNRHKSLLVTGSLPFTDAEITMFSAGVSMYKILKLARKMCSAKGFILLHGHLSSNIFPMRQSTV
jgi:hypothetical protein